MPRQTAEFRIVIASPLDMNTEREIVFDSLAELNRSLDIQGLSIKVIGWEEYSTPGVDTYAQQLVSKQILEDYDVLIALFGTRLGTPTVAARSGTVEEIEKAVSDTSSSMGEFRVQVYFRDRIDSISNISVSELLAVTDYRQSLHDRGVFYKTFQSNDHLATEVRVNVQRAINYYLRNSDTFTEKPKQIRSANPETEVTELGFLDIAESSHAAIESAERSGKPHGRACD